MAAHKKRSGSFDATLLIVNHEPQLIAGALFNGHQFRIKMMRQVEGLFDQVHTLQPDVILLGMALPGTDSFKLCRQLKMDSPGFLPVIMTGINTAPEAVASFDAGADELLIDPPHPGEILARVQLMVRLKRQYDQLLLENRQLAERLLLQNRQLEDALQEVQQSRQLSDNVVYNLAHELRTPLLQVKSAVSMMRTDGGEGGVPLMDTLIGHATAATSRLEDVVNNLSQLATAMHPQKRDEFRVQDAVLHAIRQLGRKWSSKNAVGRIDLRLGDVPPVLGDRGAVSQMLQQLIDNALKFSPEGGKVEVSAALVDQGVVVAVHDTGIGIAPEHHSLIFQAFYQVDSSSTRTFGGAGIGLTIVKMLGDAMSTRVEVKSALGKGSTFMFTLPLATF